MKRFDVIILASILSVTTFAQQRFHVQNVTDYEAVLKSSQNNTTMRNVSSRSSAPLPNFLSAWFNSLTKHSFQTP